MDARILDLATGTGIWVCELADQVPSTYVLEGADISDAQFPDSSTLASNVSLFVLNGLQPVPQNLKGIYDVVHIRWIIAAMNNEDWQTMAKNVRDLLKPGGKIHWEEANFHIIRHIIRGLPTSHCDAIQELVSGFYDLAFTSRGRRADAGPLLTEVLLKTGFSDVFDHGTSSDRQPENRADWTVNCVDGATNALMNAAKGGHPRWTVEGVNALRVKAIEEEVKSGAYMRFDLHNVIGTKPL